jgi:hypothetical protein
VFPRHQISGKLIFKDFAVYEQRKDTATEELGHRSEVTDGNEKECTVLIKTPLQNDCVKVVEFAKGKLLGSSCETGTARVPSKHIPKCLMSDDDPGVELSTRCLGVEIAEKRED